MPIEKSPPLPLQTRGQIDCACVVSSERLANGVAVVSVAGEVDMFTEPLLRDAVAATFEQGGAGLLVDLGLCTFVDSTALGTLLDANVGLRERGRRLALVVPDRSVQRALELTGLDRVFAVHDSRASALGGADSRV